MFSKKAKTMYVYISRVFINAEILLDRWNSLVRKITQSTMHTVNIMAADDQGPFY